MSSNIIKRNPFLSFCVIGIILHVVVMVSHIQYDDVGIRGYVFWLSNIFGFFIWIFNEVIFSISKGKVIPFQNIYSILMGLSICSVLDLFLRRQIFKRGNRNILTK